MGNVCPGFACLFGFKRPPQVDSEPLLVEIAPARQACDEKPAPAAMDHVLPPPHRPALAVNGCGLYADYVYNVMPNLSGKIAVVTGANSGTGFWCARALASKGATVVLACRDLAKANAARVEIEDGVRQELGIEVIVHVSHLDLASFASVRAFASDFRARFSCCHLLVNNAGVMAVEKALTVDGWDVQLQVNHLSHFLLTHELFDHLCRAPGGARVVSHSSMAHKSGSPRINAFDLNEGAMDGLCGLAGHLPGAKPYMRYGQSKLANLLFAFELHRRLLAARLDGRIMSVCAHPGLAATQLFEAPQRAGNLPSMLMCVGKSFAQSAEDGSLPLLLAATHGAVESGAFFGPERGHRGYPVRCKAEGHANDEGMARELWGLSEVAVGCRFDVALVDSRLLGG